jgi:hypothetical protein
MDAELLDDMHEALDELARWSDENEHEEEV